VEGRVTDFLVGLDGRLVSGAFLTIAIVAKRPSLGQVQLWQEVPGQVLYKIAPGGNRTISQSDVQFLESETKRYLGSGTKVEYEFVDQIPQEPSGKYRFCISEVEKTFVTA
jgi:phenylacetate-CoA ligase